MRSARAQTLGLSMLAIVVVACEDPNEPTPVPDTIALTPVVSGLDRPVFLTSPASDTRLFIVEQAGRIRVVKNGVLIPDAYLDLAGQISTGGERGLLGLAFHPDFASNGFFYVNYTDDAGDTRIERYHAGPSSDVADAGSASLVLAIDQPFANHNGGMLLFGPDGMLWIGTGDGGDANDPGNRAQTLTTLLGKMLRIDVDAAAPYGIPPDNPFVGRTDALPEIWAVGLRNPWRYAFDRETGMLYVADVGQNAWEEVHVVHRTATSINFGWKIMEGAHCRGASTCPMEGLVLPVHEYSHDETGVCSITGGFVYRGSAIPGLRGHYFYSDFCAGFLRSFRFDGEAATDHRTWDVGDLGNVLSFGEDAGGELYVLSANGVVYRLTGDDEGSE